MSSPNNLKPVTAKQLYLLKLLYKFRFATRELLEGSKQQDRSIMRKRLNLLLKLEYIGRNYDASYRQLNKPASFYLKPQAIKLLKTQPNLANSVLQNAYKDKTAGQAFIVHCLNIFTIYRKLQGLYGDNLSFYSRSELANYDHFPDKPPDAFIKIGDDEYFLDLIEADTPSFTIRRRLQSYIENDDSGNWPEDAYPTLLSICETPGQERRLQRLLSKQLAVSDADEIEAYTTTLKAMLNAPSAETKIWSDVSDPEEPIAIPSPIKK